MTNRFNEPTGKAQRYVRKSINPTTQNITTDTNGISTFSSEFGYGADNVSESKTNNNMKKNVIKLNENTLRQIVAESVKKVMKEEFSQGTFEYDFEERIIRRFRQVIDDVALKMASDMAIDERDIEEAKQAVQNVWFDSLKRGCYDRLYFEADLDNSWNKFGA